MRRFFLYIVNCIIHFLFWLRYKVEVVGFERIEALKKTNPTGVLFLPNHVAVLIDPLMTAIQLWPRHEARPLIVDYMYEIPLFNTVLRAQKSISVPDVDDPKIRVPRAEIDAINDQIVEGLKNGDDFQIYPAGRLKNSPLEILGGASMVHSIVQQYPQCNIVLVRVKGLWGSSFSKAYTGDVTPDIGATMLNGIKACLKSLIFFLPRRKVIVEFVPAPPDFPRLADRRTFNAYLERWYNLPDGLTSQQGTNPGESFIPVSLSCWTNTFPQRQEPTPKEKLNGPINPEVQASVIQILSKISGVDQTSITPATSIGTDLGMDSLQLIEAVAFLEKKYGLAAFPYHDIRTVEQLIVRTQNLINEMH